MEIIDYSDFLTCEANNFLKISVIFKDNLTKSDLYILAEDKQLIYNESFSIPFFKIISSEIIIRGSLNTNRITIEFASSDQAICKQVLEKLFLS